jgi:hypothetical protein
LICLLDLEARADGPPGTPVPSEPVFTALRVDGSVASGRIISIGPNQVILAVDENEQEELPFRSVVKLTREFRMPALAMEGSQVLLPEGDRLMRVSVVDSTETSVEVECRSALGKLEIPFDSILGLVLSPPSDSDATDLLWDRVRNEPRSTEVLWMANGDRMTGGFLGLDDRAVKLQVAGKPVEFDRTGVVAIGFDPTVTAYHRPETDFLELTLVDGTRIGMSDVKVEKGQLTGATRFGARVRIPIRDLVRIDPRTPSVIYLSERQVDAEQYVPYIGPVRPYRLDRTVDGRCLQLAGRFYDRGLGAQSRTILAYRLKPADKRFQALVGVDGRAGPLASVVCRVLTDGQNRITTPPLTSRDTPQTIDLDISQAKLLILITEFGDRGGVQDHANWVEARIIR